MGYIYALDLSMACSGVSIFNFDGGLIHICSIKTNEKKTHGYRLKQIVDQINILTKQYAPQLIIIERSFNRFNTATAVLYRLHGVINFVFWELEQIYYPPSKIKSIILKGNATKKQIQNEVLKYYPNIVFENEDESDAVSIGLAYLISNGIIKKV